MTDHKDNKVKPKHEREEEKSSVRIIDKSILTRVLPLNILLEELSTLLISEYDLAYETVQKLISTDVLPFWERLKDELFVVIETPYVDKLYRDSFYIFYASKHTKHFRDSIRLSFFNTELNEEDFLDRKMYEEKLSSNYLGFLVLRPTFPKVIGRTSLSPNALKNVGFACCTATFNATALSNKFKVDAFPHSSQDRHTITCAETTIWGIMEYFSCRYPDYKPVLPSHINKIIQKISFKRTFPSEGLTAEQVTYAIRELGFGAMIYSRKKHRHQFNTLVSIYIESGIPVIGVLKNLKGSIGHAVNIIGREVPDLSVIAKSAHHEHTTHGGELIDFNQFERKYVFMDDNFPPYQLGNLNYPCQAYFTDEADKKKWEDVDLTHIIVPLYSKIYLDAARARKNFLQALNSVGFDKELFRVEDKRIFRVFLASSRTFKQYISLDSDLSTEAKILLLGTPMPKFIWVAEISTPQSFEKNLCEGFLIQDATEPGEFSSRSQVFMHSLILGVYDKVIFRQDFGRFTKFSIKFAGPFRRFMSNLTEFK